MRPLRLLAGFVLVCASLIAQQPSVSTAPPPYRGAWLQVDGIFVTPIPGAPMTATVLIQSGHYDTDSSMENRQTTIHIARDAQGRIYNERRMMVTSDFQGQPPLLGAHIFDPVAGLNTFLNPDRRIARQSKWQGRPAGAASMPLDAAPGTQDLGTKVMLGETVHGRRITTTVPLAASGTGTLLEVVDEYWYSDDLHLNFLVTHTDPRTGVQRVQITELHRGEPPAEMLTIPRHYKVVDVTPPE